MSKYDGAIAFYLERAELKRILKEWLSATEEHGQMLLDDDATYQHVKNLNERGAFE
jgi:hypothetical protein